MTLVGKADNVKAIDIFGKIKDLDSLPNVSIKPIKYNMDGLEKTRKTMFLLALHFLDKLSKYGEILLDPDCFHA